jgi:hypothetical protein
MLYFLVGVGILAYVTYRIVDLLRTWRDVVDDTVAQGRARGETSGQIAADVAEEAAVGTVKVAAALAVGEIVDEVGGAGAAGAGGLSGGGGGGAGF